MTESAIVFGRERSLVGVLTEKGTPDLNANEEYSKTGILLLSSGLDHHVGPNRIYVKLARRLAESGRLSLRFGFSGIGDSGPRRDKLPAEESVVDETRQAMDYLENLRGIKEFCCVGLCAGADASAMALKEDHRAKKGILINPSFTRAAQGIVEQRIIYQKYAYFSKKSWLRLITLRSDYQRIWRMLKAVFEKKIVSGIFKESGNDDAIDKKIKEYFQIIKSKDVQMLMVFSHTEFGDIYLKNVLGKEYGSLIKSGILSISRIKNADHSLMQLACQNELISLISSFLDQKP
jgi:hypothetical protein